MTIYTFMTATSTQYRVVDQGGSAVLWREGQYQGRLVAWRLPEMGTVFYYNLSTSDGSYPARYNSTMILSLQTITIS